MIEHKENLIRALKSYEPVQLPPILHFSAPAAVVETMAHFIPLARHIHIYGRHWSLTTMAVGKACPSLEAFTFSQSFPPSLNTYTTYNYCE